MLREVSLDDGRKRMRSPSPSQSHEDDQAAKKPYIGDTEINIQEEVSRLRAMPGHFDPAVCPPPQAKAPRMVVVLMRHGDRSIIPSKIGTLDISRLASAWEGLMPTEEDQTAMDRIPLHLGKELEKNAYAAHLGSRPWGQLTSRGVAQCKAVGAELRRRYPAAGIQAFSTNFPRTKQSAAAVLLGFGARQDVPITVCSSSEEVLLPNFDGRCRRYDELRADLITKAEGGCLRQVGADLEAILEPVIGPKPLKAQLDLRPLCMHEKALGVVPGIDWRLAHRCEEYLASKEAAIFENTELVRLACGRLLHWVVGLLAEPGHEIVLMLAHDNMLTAFLVALGIFKREWPIYASAVVIETADFDGDLKARVHVNNEVRRDWAPWDAFVRSTSSLAMTGDQYEAACSVDSPR